MSKLGTRVANIGENVDEWCRNGRGDGASTYDVCVICADKLVTNPHQFDHVLKPYQSREPQGVDGWEDDVDHPPYDDDETHCAVCKVELHD